MVSNTTRKGLSRGLLAGLDGDTPCLVAEHARVFAAPDFAALLKIVEMGDGLAHGEESLVRIGDVALEQHRQERGGGMCFLAAGSDEVGAAVGVVIFQRRHARVYATEGAAV